MKTIASLAAFAAIIANGCSQELNAMNLTSAIMTPMPELVMNSSTALEALQRPMREAAEKSAIGLSLIDRNSECEQAKEVEIPNLIQLGVKGHKFMPPKPVIYQRTGDQKAYKPSFEDIRGAYDQTDLEPTPPSYNLGEKLPLRMLDGQLPALPTLLPIAKSQIGILPSSLTAQNIAGRIENPDQDCDRAHDEARRAKRRSHLDLEKDRVQFEGQLDNEDLESFPKRIPEMELEKRVAASKNFSDAVLPQRQEQKADGSPIIVELVQAAKLKEQDECDSAKTGIPSKSRSIQVEHGILTVKGRPGIGFMDKKLDIPDNFDDLEPVSEKGFKSELSDQVLQPLNLKPKKSALIAGNNAFDNTQMYADNELAPECESSPSVKQPVSLQQRDSRFKTFQPFRGNLKKISGSIKPAAQAGAVNSTGKARLTLDKLAANHTQGMSFSSAPLSAVPVSTKDSLALPVSTTSVPEDGAISQAFRGTQA